MKNKGEAKLGVEKKWFNEEKVKVQQQQQKKTIEKLNVKENDQITENH